MADRRNYDMSKKVSHKTIADIRKMGMSKAIERANSGEAGDEFTEAARRFYGKRIKSAKKKGGGPAMSHKSTPHVTGEAAAEKPHGYRGDVPKGSPAVMGEAAAETAKPTRTYKEPKPTINQRFRKAVLGKSDKVKLF